MLLLVLLFLVDLLSFLVSLPFVAFHVLELLLHLPVPGLQGLVLLPEGLLGILHLICLPGTLLHLVLPGLVVLLHLEEQLFLFEVFLL